MFTGRAEVELLLPSAYSLKDKRQILRSLTERLRQRFNLAVAEVAHQEEWNRAGLGLASVSNDAGHARRVLEEALRFIEADGRGEIVEQFVEVI